MGQILDKDHVWCYCTCSSRHSCSGLSSPGTPTLFPIPPMAPNPSLVLCSPSDHSKYSYESCLTSPSSHYGFASSVPVSVKATQPLTTWPPFYQQDQLHGKEIAFSSYNQNNPPKFTINLNKSNLPSRHSSLKSPQPCFLKPCETSVHRSSSFTGRSCQQRFPLSPLRSPQTGFLTAQESLDLHIQRSSSFSERSMQQRGPQIDVKSSQNPHKIIRESINLQRSSSVRVQTNLGVPNGYLPFKRSSSFNNRSNQPRSPQPTRKSSQNHLNPNESIQLHRSSSVRIHHNHLDLNEIKPLKRSPSAPLKGPRSPRSPLSPRSPRSPRHPRPPEHPPPPPPISSPVFQQRFPYNPPVYNLSPYHMPQDASERSNSSSDLLQSLQSHLLAPHKTVERQRSHPSLQFDQAPPPYKTYSPPSTPVNGSQWLSPQKSVYRQRSNPCLKFQQSNNVSPSRLPPPATPPPPPPIKSPYKQLPPLTPIHYPTELPSSHRQPSLNSKVNHPLKSTSPQPAQKTQKNQLNKENTKQNQTVHQSPLKPLDFSQISPHDSLKRQLSTHISLQSQQIGQILQIDTTRSIPSSPPPQYPQQYQPSSTLRMRSRSQSPQFRPSSTQFCTSSPHRVRSRSPSPSYFLESSKNPHLSTHYGSSTLSSSSSSPIYELSPEFSEGIILSSPSSSFIYNKHILDKPLKRASSSYPYLKSPQSQHLAPSPLSSSPPQTLKTSKKHHPLSAMSSHKSLRKNYSSNPSLTSRKKHHTSSYKSASPPQHVYELSPEYPIQPFYPSAPMSNFTKEYIKQSPLSPLSDLDFPVCSIPPEPSYNPPVLYPIPPPPPPSPNTSALLASRCSPYGYPPCVSALSNTEHYPIHPAPAFSISSSSTHSQSLSPDLPPFPFDIGESTSDDTQQIVKNQVSSPVRRRSKKYKSTRVAPVAMSRKRSRRRTQSIGPGV